MTTPDERKVVKDKFLAEVQKAPNALAILELFHRWLQLNNQDDLEDLITMKVEIALRDRHIESLQQQIRRLQSPSTHQPQHRRWN